MMVRYVTTYQDRVRGHQRLITDIPQYNTFQRLMTITVKAFGELIPSAARSIINVLIPGTWYI